MADGSRLVLIRHAKSDYPWGVVDHDRPLNDRGRRDAPVMGAWLDAHLSWAADDVPQVRVSTARRAQLTWSLARTRMSGRWDSVRTDDDARIYAADVPTLLDVATSAADTATLLLVGHNPGLVDLLEVLSTDDDLHRQATAKFPTCSVAVLASTLPLRQACDQRDFRVVAFATPRG